MPLSSETDHARSPLLSPYTGALLATASFGAFLANFCAGAHLTAFENVAKSLDVTVAQVASAIGIGILGLGFGPLIWGPLASSIGRRPTWLLAWSLFFLTTIWISLSGNYANFEASRFLAGFTSSVSQSVPGAQIADVFSQRHRGLCISVWTFAIVSGPVTAPIICAGILTVTTWRWMYWLIVILAGATLVAVFFFVPETLVIEENTSSYAGATTSSQGAQNATPDDVEDKKDQTVLDTGSSHSSSRSGAHALTSSQREARVGVAWYPWKEPVRFCVEMFAPFRMALYLPVLVPSIVYSVFFGWSVGMTVITPQVFLLSPWNFSNVGIGASFMASFVGSAIGKFVGGWFSDFCVTQAAKRQSKQMSDVDETTEPGGLSSLVEASREPEPRMWALLFGLPFLFIGAFFYGYGIQMKLAWPVAVVVGMGAYYVGVNATQSVVQTYVVECQLSKAAYSMALFNLIKCIFAFGVTYYIPEWAAKDYWSCYGACAGIALGLGLLLAAWLLTAGKTARRWQGECEKGEKMIISGLFSICLFSNLPCAPLLSLTNRNDSLIQ